MEIDKINNNTKNSIDDAKNSNELELINNNNNIKYDKKKKQKRKDIKN